MTKSLFSIGQMAIDECNGDAAFLVVIDKDGEMSNCCFGVKPIVGSMFILSKAINYFIEIDGFTLNGVSSENETNLLLSEITNLAINEYNGIAAIVIVLNKDGGITASAKGLTFVGKMAALTKALSESIPLSHYTTEGKCGTKLNRYLKGKDAIFA